MVASCILAFLTAVTMMTRSQAREEGFILAHGLRVQPMETVRAG